MSEKPDAFKDSEALHKLAFQISLAVPELADARSANWKAFYSKKEMEEKIGKCRHLDGAVKHQTTLDFFIIIQLRRFTEADDFHRMRAICHELYHIEKAENSFGVRYHAGDFCEIAEHDRFSYRLALKAMAELGVRYGNLEEIRKYAHIDRLDGRNELTKDVVERPRPKVVDGSQSGRMLPLDPDQ